MKTLKILKTVEDVLSYRVVDRIYKSGNDSVSILNSDIKEYSFLTENSTFLCIVNEREKVFGVAAIGDKGGKARVEIYRKKLQSKGYQELGLSLIKDRYKI